MTSPRLVAVVGVVALALIAAIWALWPGFRTDVRKPGSNAPSTGPPPSSTEPTTQPSTQPNTQPSAPPDTDFPTRASAGLPQGWEPKHTATGDLWVREPGAVVEDLRITDGTIHIAAPDVTLRRIEAVASVVVDDAEQCHLGLVIEDSDFVPGSAPTTEQAWPAVSAGAYTLRNVVVDGLSEGLRVANHQGCGTVSVEDSYVRVASPDQCHDWHGDGLQGYGGGRLEVRRTVMILEERADCGGTAPFFFPTGQGNSGPVDIDGLLVQGGGYPFRLGVPGSIRNLAVVEDSWGYQPLEVDCSLMATWQAQIVTLDRSGRAQPVRSLPCQ